MDEAHLLDDPTQCHTEKVAIVGIGCRFPNYVDNVGDFWKMLVNGTDCTSPHISDRLPKIYLYPGQKLPGKIYTRRAGYLKHNLEYFDREFFQIPPDEATHMDPQIRLLLETVWEGLEDAGIPAPSIRGTDTGVFIGVMAKEYTTLLGKPEYNINQYTASGNNSNMISNRISFQFDFRGPSLSIDTACSSSLFAIHGACQALRDNQCGMAIAGGVNLLVLPSTTISICQAGMASIDGTCKSFDNSADGYARGEGAGVIVLKPLKKALQDNDRIYAVIRGGALNNDGKTAGISTPSSEAQIALLRRAYQLTRVKPEEVPYIEAHGTGTKAGDKAEATAMGEVLGRPRGKMVPPLFIGSVKSNIGHTEGAAGVAGVIKAALVLYKKQIPKIVHLKKRNTNIDWDDVNIVLPRELTKWPVGAKLIAGCSSFGFGGANAHLVLEGTDNVIQTKLAITDGLSTTPSLLFLSAYSPQALKQRVENFIKFLVNDVLDNTTFLAAMYTSAVRSTHHSHRLVIVSESFQQTVDCLKKRKEDGGQPMDNCVIEGKVLALTTAKKLVFVFSGMGTQWWGMGRQLIRSDKIFRDSIKAIDAILKTCGSSWSLWHMLTIEDDSNLMNRTDIAQPSICAIQIALVDMYRHYGVIPEIVIGHSVGEVAAAHVAGHISLRDAIGLIYIRGKLLQETSGEGGMVAVLHSHKDVANRLKEYDCKGKIDIACINSPSQVVLSGDIEALVTFVNSLTEEGIRCIYLKVNNAFHSYQQEQVSENFFNMTSFLRCNSESGKQTSDFIPMISSVTGKFQKAEDSKTSSYWWKNIRQTVFFQTAVESCLSKGFNIFLEIGPHPSLSSAIKGTMALSTLKPDRVAIINSLRRPEKLEEPCHDKRNILLSLGKLHVEGYQFDMRSLYPASVHMVMSLPTYPWQRQLCSSVTQLAKQLFMGSLSSSPLKGKPIITFSNTRDESERIWRLDYTKLTLPWLHHHQIQNMIVMPGAGFMELMLSVIHDLFPGQNSVAIEDIQFNKFHFSPNCSGSLDVLVKHIDNRRSLIEVRTYNEKKQNWILNVSGMVIHKSDTGKVATIQESDKLAVSYIDIESIMKRCSVSVSKGKFYDTLSRNEVQIGSTFACVNDAHYNHDTNEALVFCSLPEVLENEEGLYTFHPALLDTTFQTLAGFSLFPNGDDTETKAGELRVPKSVHRMYVQGSAPSKIIIHALGSQVGVDLICSTEIADATTGRVFASLDNFRLGKVDSRRDTSSCVLWNKQWTQIDMAQKPFEDDDRVDVIPQIPFNEGSTILIADRVGVTDLLKSMLDDDTICSQVVHSDELQQPNNFAAKVKREAISHIIVMATLDVEKQDHFSAITKEDFTKSQEDTMVMMVNLIKMFQFEDLNQVTVWIVTKGAINPGMSDDVNPLMVTGNTLGMCAMHELTAFLGTIDLPLAQPVEQSARWLNKFLKNMTLTENYVALRHTNPQEEDFQVLAIRLAMQSTSDLYFPSDTGDWSIDLNGSRMGRTICRKSSSQKNYTNVDVQSKERALNEISVACFLKTNYRETVDTLRLATGFIYAGNVTGEASQTGKNKCKNTFVLGYQHCPVVEMKIMCPKNNYISLPNGISYSDSITIVDECLPFYTALQHQIGNIKGKRILLVSSSQKSHVTFARCIAATEEATLFLYGKDDFVSSINDDKSVKLVSRKYLNDVIEAGEIDIMIISPNTTLENEEVEMLLSKIRLFGSVAYFSHVPNQSIVKHVHKLKNRQTVIQSIDMNLMWFKDHFHHTKLILKSLFEMILPWMAIMPKTQDFFLQYAIQSNQFDRPVSVDQTSEVLVPVSYDDVHDPFTVDSDVSFLVVGGTKGVGFELVKWLARSGAKMVHIVGRNDPNQDILEEIERLQEDGIQIKCVKCDITDEQATEMLLHNIHNVGKFALAGIFHCAAVFHDQNLQSVTRETWNKVMLPKAYGVLLLHQLTLKLNIKLTYFVAMSSIVQFWGNIGQGTYCVANAFISALCWARRKQGLPATVIAPGTIADAGYAAREGYDKFWEERGMKSLKPEQIIKNIEWSLATERFESGITGPTDTMRFAESKFSVFYKQFRKDQFSVFKSLFTDLVGIFAIRANKKVELTSLSASEIKIIVCDVLLEFLRKKLGLSDEVLRDASLVSLGFDSAMSWELSELIFSKFDVTVYAMELLNDSMRIEDLVVLVSTRAVSSVPTKAKSTTPV